jgi:RND family efflux transporter MFP subunit
METPRQDEATETETTKRPRAVVPLSVAITVGVVLAVGGAMVLRAESRTNKVALAASPKPVTVTKAAASTYRPSRAYVGTFEPWVSAEVGPQFVSAYVDTVLVRPGASVKKGDVLATLDCRNASATAQAVSMQARALDARQQAASHEASRVQGLLDGGFVSPNEAEQKSAQSAAEEASLLAEKAKLLGTSLAVNDCVLRAPFDGEIATRSMDPGAFARPGVPIVSVVDRKTVRLTADAPEIDFDVVAPSTPVRVHVLATNKDRKAQITRRAPSADPATRTVHFEIDVADPDREIPVNTTGEVQIDVGAPVPATEIPLYAASLRGTKASVFVIEGDTAHARTFSVKGESGGSVFLDTALPPGALVVTEGRALLADGDKVSAKEAAAAPLSASSGAPEPKP